jgi:hypothetical protein
MARFAIIEGGVVANIVEAEFDYAVTQGWVDASSANIGDTYSNGQFSEPVPVVDPLAYQAQRAAEYPSINDYVDGIVKGDQVQVQAYIDACLAIKAKYPKP